MADEDAQRVEDVDATADLLARAQTGDEEALNRLFERHIPLLKRWGSAASRDGRVRSLTRQTWHERLQRCGDAEA